jgi:hypothetical protein
MSSGTQQQQQQQELHSGMKPDFYNQHSTTQGNAVDLCRHLLLQAANDMPLPINSQAADTFESNKADGAQQQQQQQHGYNSCCCCCIHVAEWGCSHGANSIAPVLLIAEALQQRLAAAANTSSSSSEEDKTLQQQQQQQQQFEVHFSHVDVPSNDFTALFSCSRQYTRTLQQACPLLHVTSSAVGSSMYSRNFPRRSLSLGFSFSSLHWQSSRAVRLSKTVNPGCSKVSMLE